MVHYKQGYKPVCTLGDLLRTHKSLQVLTISPNFVGGQSKERAPRRATMRRRPAQPADPVQPARSAEPEGEKREGPPAPPSFGKHRCLKHRVCRRSGGTGSGG